MLLAFLTCAGSAHGQEWHKGNLHTHSLWSDGDDYPEMIVQWYIDHGYDFLAISDHNSIQDGEKWVTLPDSGAAWKAFERYAGHFGPEWVVTREAEGHTQVRLRTFDEYRNLLAEEGEFLLIRSEEITERYEGRPIHVNATNIRDFIPPQGGNSVLEVMQNNVDAVLEQRKRTGQDMFPHLNHPNYEYAISLADFIALEGDRFFEVYNGHPLVNNHGDHDHPGTETMWDFALSHRLVDGRGVLYGLATDDAHKYHESSPKHANPGRGWVMVRAESLETDAIIAALEAGDFYASSGVTLSDVQVSEDSIWIEIQPDSGVIYTTQFVGTTRDFDPSNITASTRIGRVLSEVEGTTASYRFRGD